MCRSIAEYFSISNGQSQDNATRRSACGLGGGDFPVSMLGFGIVGEGLLFYPYMLGERRRENTAGKDAFFGITLKHAAFLGAAGVGLIDDLVAEALRRRVVDKTVSPQAANADVYKAALQDYSRVYDHMLGFWRAE